MNNTRTVVRRTFEPAGWDLSELLPDSGEETIASRIAEVEAGVAAFEARREELRPDMESAVLLSILGDYETLVERSYILGAYGSLWFSADTQSPEALTYRNQVEHLLTGLHNRILFFSLWWKGLAEDEVSRLLPSADEEPDARHYLEDLRRLEPYTLDERSEQIVNIKDANGMSAVLTLYSMLTNRLEFELEIDGATGSLSRDELMAHVYSPDADRREAVYRELYRVYDGEANILSQLYVNRVRDWHSENIELRSFASPIAVRNVANDVPDEAVETLLAVAAEHAHVFQRYFRLKAGWLGLDRLRRYDIYAPLAASTKEVPYDEGVRLVLDTMASFDGTMAEMAERVFTERHIDSELRKGKRGGAFCATITPDLTPWVLANYAGRVRDVATLAHELGHAVHSMLAADHTILTQHPSLPLAETASVFSEMLLTERLLEHESDPLARRELLASALDDIYATVLRQAYFVRFEQAAHRAILEGRSPGELDELYLGTLRDQFGDSLDLGEEFRREWITIPHIYHTPFYCYAYSFGQLLVLALYQQYKEQGPSFIPGYLRLLAHGGSSRPEEILAEVGVDPRDTGFWRGGFEVVSGMVDELERLG